MVEYIVDVQGFRDDNNGFIVEEFAIANWNQENDVKWVIFEPPFDRHCRLLAKSQIVGWLEIYMDFYKILVMLITMNIKKL